MGKLFTLKGVTVTEQIRDSVGKFRTVASKQIGLSGNIKGLSKFAKGSLIEMGKWIVLAKTARFLPAVGIVGVAGLGIGYILGNSNNKKDEDMGLVVEKEPVAETPTTVAESLKAYVTQTKENQYYQIKTAGMTWAGIIETYYPELVEKCDGQMYGSDGAIRKLKLALQTCCQGDLLKMTDIPKVLNLPLELDGIKIKTDTEIKKGTIVQEGGTSSVDEAGCKSSKLIYTVTDPQNKQEYSHENLNTAIDSLKARTNVEEYKLDYAS